MSEKLKIPAGGHVLVCDGHKALVLRNEGDEIYPNLRVQDVFEAPPNPPTRDQGDDKPARRVGGGRRSPIDQTDWHVLAKQDFADEVAAALERANRRDPIASLVVVAPPPTLAELRRVMAASLRRVISAEIGKDLTRHPVHEIERHLTAA